MLIVGLLLPYGIKIHETTSDMFLRWKSDVGRCSKLEYRRLQGLQSLRCYTAAFGYTFFLLKKSAKPSYYAAIFQYTTDCMIVIPSELFK